MLLKEHFFSLALNLKLSNAEAGKNMTTVDLQSLYEKAPKPQNGVLDAIQKWPDWLFVQISKN